MATLDLATVADNVLEPFKLNHSNFRNVTLSEIDGMPTWDMERYQFYAWRNWMGEIWTASLYISVIYVALIFLGQRWMRNREPFELKTASLLWNLSLGIMSFTGFSRAAPEVFHVFRTAGFHESLCNFDTHTERAAFWGLINILSRFVELGGTAFIVLKKRPLIFLHWYHHVTVLIYCWYFYQAYEISLRVFGFMNSFVHSVVYFYFVLKGLGVKMPRKLSMFLTGIQLSEMFIGIAVNLYNLNMKNKGVQCHREYASIYAALTMYATYFVLFAKLFRDSYLVPRRKPAVERKKRD